MPTTSSTRSRSYTIVKDGQKLDRKLLDAFKRAAVGGSVDKGAIEDKIAKRLRDGGKLTDVEIATCEYAAKHWKLTTGAKNALGAIALEMRGKAVFAWQRTSDVVDIRAGGATAAEKKRIEGIATDWVLHNMEPVLGASADKALPHVDSGNNGFGAVIVSGKKAKQVVELFKLLEGSNPALDGYDPKKHTVILGIGTEDETHIFPAILDNKTGKTTFISDQNTVDITSSVDEADFVKVFGDWKQFTSDPSDDSAEYDYVDGYALAEYFEKGANHLALPSQDGEAGFEALNAKASEVTEALGDRTYSMPCRVDAGVLPVVEDLPAMANLMFQAGRDEDSGIHYVHDGERVDVGNAEAIGATTVADIAKAMVASYPHEKGDAALPDVTKRVQDTIAALGDAANVRMFQVTSTVKQTQTQKGSGPPPQINPPRPVEARGWALINEKTGQWASFYTRPDAP